MSLTHQIYTIGRGCLCARHQPARVKAQAHRAAHVGDGVLVRHQTNDGMGSAVVELGAVGRVTAQHIAGQLDHHHLQAQA